MRQRHQGKINRTNSGSKESSQKPLIGTLSVTRKGVGYFSYSDFKEDVEVSSADLNTGLHGDTVEVELTEPKNNKRRSGKITSIIERNTNELVGTLKYEGDQLLLEPDDRRMYVNVVINQESSEKIPPDTKALVGLSPWSDSKRLPEGSIVEIIGKKGLHETEMRSIVLGHGFKTNFEQQIEEEAKEIEKNKKIEKDEIQKRRDILTTLFP
jgi:ribonuclease R